MEENTEGNYAYFNSPNSSDDWNTKENLEGQDCADPANYNDRILAPVVEDTVLLACFGFCSGDGTGVCPAGDPALMLQGIIDFTVPEGGSSGKAIHLYVNEDIADLAQYGIGVANNGGGTDGQEYTFPTAAPTAGQHILVVRDLDAMDSYLNASQIFDHVFVSESTVISQNGDDAIELFKIISSSPTPTSHTVSSGNYYYTPTTLNLNTGDTVVWLNNGGFHNVNFVNSSITGLPYGNPESFITAPTTGPVLATHVFNISGSYTYDCSVGSHAINGMVGYLNVTNNTTFTSVVVETFGDINVDGSGTAWEYMDSWAYKDTSGSVTFSGNNWIFGGVNCTHGSTTTYT